jgi:hypothetical protein
VGSNLRIYLNFESPVPEDDEHEWRRLATPTDISLCEEGKRCSSGQTSFAACVTFIVGTFWRWTNVGVKLICYA